MLVTIATRDSIPFFRDAAFAHEAIRTLYGVQELRPFLLYGFAIMPDHCHLLLRVPAPDKISTIMRVYKYGVTFNLGMGPIWQSRFHLQIPTDASDILRYIHRNPVRAGLCAAPEDYPWSSACGKWEVTGLER